MKGEFEKGLENVVALESSITFIDGEKGILQYRGHDVEKLANLTYDEVSYLLIHGKILKKNLKLIPEFSKMSAGSGVT